MDPNRYVNEHSKKPEIPEKNVPPVQPRNTVNESGIPSKPPVNETRQPSPAPCRRPARPVQNTGRLCVSGKRFFGQILIDHWVIRINGEQRELPFGQNKLSLELPAGTYLVTAYTPYLGMHCMRVTADIEIRPGATTNISYQTVFDIFKNGIMRQRPAM